MLKVDAVQQWAREPGEVVGALRGRADAGAKRRAAATARIRGADELEARGERRAARGAGDDDLPLFERLAQGLENALGEFGQLVHEEHAVMGEADLAGMGNAAAADQARIGGGVMGRAERPLGDEPPLGGQEPPHAPHHGHLDRLVQREWRQDAREATGEHRFPRARRPQHDHVVRPRGGDLERALGVGVTPDVGEVDGVGGRGGQPSADI